MFRNPHLAPRLVVLAALTVPAVAFDAAADPIDDHGVRLGDWADRATRMMKDPVEYRGETAKGCENAIADARAAGITETQRVASYNFQSHPKAQPVDGRMVWSLTLDEVQYYCESIRIVATYSKERDAFDAAARSLEGYNDLRRVQAEAMTESQIAEAHEVAERCRAAWDRLHAAGIPDDLPYSRTRVAFGELRAEVCDPLDEAIDRYAKLADEKATALREKWERAGVGGEKLSVMMQYDGAYWYLPGGRRVDDRDAKVLARAKVTYQWFTGTDPDTGMATHTIRKYRWKGNKLVAVTEHAYVGSIDDRVFK